MICFRFLPIKISQSFREETSVTGVESANTVNEFLLGELNEFRYNLNAMRHISSIQAEIVIISHAFKKRRAVSSCHWITYLRVTVTGTACPKISSVVTVTPIGHICCRRKINRRLFFSRTFLLRCSRMKKKIDCEWKKKRTRDCKNVNFQKFLRFASRRDDAILDASFIVEESASYAPSNANSFSSNCVHLSRICPPND